MGYVVAGGWRSVAEITTSNLATFSGQPRFSAARTEAKPRCTVANRRAVDKTRRARAILDHADHLRRARGRGCRRAGVPPRLRRVHEPKLKLVGRAAQLPENESPGRFRAQVHERSIGRLRRVRHRHHENRHLTAARQFVDRGRFDVGRCIKLHRRLPVDGRAHPNRLGRARLPEVHSVARQVGPLGDLVVSVLEERAEIDEVFLRVIARIVRGVSDDRLIDDQLFQTIVGNDGEVCDVNRQEEQPFAI